MFVRTLRRVRIVHSSDDTIRFATALLSLFAFPTYPTYESVYTLTRDMKSQLHAATGPPDVGLKEYPEYPKDCHVSCSVRLTPRTRRPWLGKLTA